MKDVILKQIGFLSGESFAGATPVFVSSHKCGSTMLVRLAADLFKVSNRKFINIPGILFNAGRVGIDNWVSEVIAANSGVAYIGFRNIGPIYDALHNDSIGQFRVFALIRHPLDALVSNYYPLKKSHPIPEQGPARELILGQRTDLDEVSLDSYLDNEFALYEQGENSFLSRYQETFARLGTIKSEVRMYKYESTVFYKYSLLRDLATHLDIKIDDTVLVDVARRHDVFHQEDSSNHIRQVNPGDFYRKVDPSKIRGYENSCASVLHAFGYDITSDHLTAWVR
jgi:hypothetical protein